MIDSDCTGCTYALPVVNTAGDDILVKCRRFPPQIVMDEDGRLGNLFPDAWMRCGEYKE